MAKIHRYYRYGLCAILASTALCSAQDRLVSRRLRDRGLDANGNYNISIYHINDVHAHLDEFQAAGTDCVDPTKGCYGGYARVKHIIDKERLTKEDSLFLNAGDEFQGTLFYTFYKGEKIAETLNQLGFDAMTLGNHEFDGGDDLLANFLGNLTFPIVSSNIVTTHQKLNSSLVPYLIFPKHELAIIAATTETTVDTSSPGKGTKFEDPVTSLQRTADYVREHEKVNRVIALTHIGYDKDIELAKKSKGISLIVGGHSHTLLGDFNNSGGPYPTIAKNLDGDEVFIVTAYRWGEYLGYIDVVYDREGKIVSYEGAPIHLTNTTQQNLELEAQIKEWKKPFEKFAAEVIGETKVVFEMETCQKKECTLGDYMSDAILDYRKNRTDLVIINAGSIRSGIDKGPITRGQVLTAFPFQNAVVELQFTGSYLWKVFEGIMSGISKFNLKRITSFLQVSKGVEIEYNPLASKLISIKINGKCLQMDKEYTVATLDFLANGGDNFWPAQKGFTVLDTQDEVLTAYINKTSPVNVALDGRIKTSEKAEGGCVANTTSEYEGNGNGTRDCPSKIVILVMAIVGSFATLQF